ncbi:hypothetical protein R3P38DRAFT_1848912 [Favolaschia claudopus]|uniref:Uncharacterized protein n=1 Tax=Favolaschia claudopus TaxID=2862362 RepID=A0AAW0D805_9AGAR
MSNEDFSQPGESWFDKLSKDLQSVFEDKRKYLSRPVPAKIEALLLQISYRMNRELGSLSAILRARGEYNQDFITKVEEATRDGTGYSFLTDLFSNSIRELTAPELESRVAAYLEKIQPALEAFLVEKEPLRLWVPNPEQVGSHAEFLRALKIPLNADGDGPDMLLHNLGFFMNDPSLRARIERLFPPLESGNATNTILLNTSGSGKTRTVLEGLCLFWGLYLTCEVDVDRRGSKDLQRTMDRIGSDPCFQKYPPSSGQTFMDNSGIAGRRFRELLFSRLCIMVHFCELAAKVSGPRLGQHFKKLWVYLQIQPSCLGYPNSDIFESLTQEIRGAPSFDVSELIAAKMDRLKVLLGQELDERPLICVIDEAQVAAKCFEQAFRTSNPNDVARRPVLRELLAVFSDTAAAELSVNITGTALDQESVMRIASSRVFKKKPKSITHFGAFNEAQEQINYMKQFLPLQIANQKTFQVLFERVSYWLKGRYRFTAAYMQNLLVTGFQRPHKMLNAFISVSTQVEFQRDGELHRSPGFCPSDYEEEVEQEEGEAAPAELMPFGFDKLQNYPSLVQVARECAAQYWMRASINPQVAGTRGPELINCGFARYAENDSGKLENSRITVDEPLSLLALIEWLQVRERSFAELFRLGAANGSTDADGSNGPEEELALYLSVAFEAQIPLMDIFHFHEGVEPSWAKCSAELVCLFVGEGGQEEGRVRHLTRPWLRGDSRAPICFPDKSMGPDLLFVLKLKNGKYIWVALQSKYQSVKDNNPDTGLKAETLRKAILTVTPVEFFGARVRSRAVSTHLI